MLKTLAHLQVMFKSLYLGTKPYTMSLIYFLIGVPVFLLFAYLTGMIVRAMVFKVDQSKGGTSNTIMNIVVGAIAIVVIATLFKGCNGSENYLKQ